MSYIEGGGGAYSDFVTVMTIIFIAISEISYMIAN